MQDFLVDENNDLKIQNGDFVVGFSDFDHIIDIIDFNQGDLVEYPQIGVGIINYLNSSGKQQELNRRVRLMMEADKWSPKTIEQVLTKGVLTENIKI